jgi:hypothetical protein
MKTRKTRTKARKGGRKIGQGSYGVVYKPPLICSRKPEISTKYRDGFVGKQVTEEEVDKEIHASDLIETVDPNEDYTLHVRAYCDISPEQENANFLDISQGDMQLIYRDGGQSLYSLMDPDILNFDDVTDVNFDNLILGLRLIKGFMPNLREFNQHFIHNDLHLGNIVWDGEALRMIDFAELKTVDELIEIYAKHNKKNPEEMARKRDVEILYHIVRDIARSKYMKNNHPALLRYWLMSTPEEPRELETYYERLEALPV